MGEFRGALDEAFHLERMLDVAFDTPRPLAGLNTAVSAPTTIADAIGKMTTPALAADMWSVPNLTTDLKVDDLLGEYKTTASMVQEFASADYGLNVEAMKPCWQLSAPNNPLTDFMSAMAMVNPIGRQSSWMSASPGRGAWRAALGRWAEPPIAASTAQYAG